MVGRFRLFDKMDINSSDNKMSHYISTYSTEALTEPEILNSLSRVAEAEAENQVDSNKRIKRLGPDAEDHYWMFGKIHGLENIAYLTEEQIHACNGNPVLLQEAINAVEIPKGVPQTYEQRAAAFRESLNEYKKSVDKCNLLPTDRKKMLSLPFFMSKRQELPEPKQGQTEWDLFMEMYGRPWNAFDNIQFDTEEKITQFNYEKFIHDDILATMDTESEEFKDMIKFANFSSKTKYEQHQTDQAKFKELMPLLSQLNAKEQRDLVHMLESQSDHSLYLDQIVSGAVEKELAKLSEEENYAIKNAYRHKNKTMAFADPKKMPIDERKVKDMLRNQHIFRDRLN